MEATKKTSITKAALLVVAALSMLLSGLFIATASRSDASPPPACPDGFALTADAKNCFQAAVITSADNPNSCAKGTLTPDGTKCFVEARLLPQVGSTLCPDGYSPDSSLNDMCAKFEPATQGDPGCPDGAAGVADGCYILVAFGPKGDAECAEGTLAGSLCVVEGDAPVATEGECAVSSTVFLDGDFCYSVLTRPTTSGACTAPYVVFGTVCKAANPDQQDPATAADWECPAIAGETISEEMHTVGGITKISSCEYPRPSDAGDCPATTDVEVNGECRRAVEIKPGPKACADDDYSFLDGKCIKYVTPDQDDASCPQGSLKVPGKNECRQPVANKAGSYYCKDAAAALNGKTCVWTTGFLAEAAPNQYKCDEGTRAVIGDGAGKQVICWLGDADPNLESGPSCLQGVLSTDGLYCIVPRIDTAPAAVAAAPVQAFTG